MRILVIDDNKIALASMHRMLTGLGHRCFTALSGAEGLLALDLFRGIDLVITDYVLPDFDGVEVLRRIRAHSGSIPVWLLSGLDVDCDDWDFDLCLVKPISRDALTILLATIPKPRKA